MLLRASSPHLFAPRDTGWVMRQVLLAAVPGLAALTWFFGWGVVWNILLASVSAVLCEIFAIRLRGRAPGFYLRDGSVLVTALLLGLALPPYCPWWVTVTGTAFAVLVGKHVYGGLGYNPFNPAMAGYVMLLISFPVEMTAWPAPRGAPQGYVPPGLWQSMQLSLQGAPMPDAFTMATPLDLFRGKDGMTVDELWQSAPQFGLFGGRGWEWVNLGFLAGGLYLMWRHIFTWHAPLGMLGAMVLLSALFYAGGGSGSAGSPLMHLGTGATMLGAFFIITDPVSSAVSNRGRLVFGIGAGALIFSMRTWSNYPDGVAFAVLLMNFSAPFIDNYTQPRTYGHGS